MKLKPAVKPTAILVGTAILTVWLVKTKPVPEIVAPVVRPLLVEVLEVHPQRLAVSVRAQGIVQPAREISLVSEVRGRVVAADASFRAGGFFREGEVMLRIDDRDYVARLDQAKALVAQARSALAQEKGRAYVAEKEWNRRAGKETVSADAQRLALRKPQLQEAHAQLDSAQASLRLAEIEVERTQIRAPFDGLVESQEVDLGQFINAGAPLGHFLDLSVAEVRLAIPESKLPYIDLPDPYLQRSPGVAGAAGSETGTVAVTLSHRIDGVALSWPARLVRTEGVLDERSRSLFVVAQLADPYGVYRDKGEGMGPLRFGMFVEALIDGREVDELIALPRAVIRPGNQVWVVDEQERLRPQEVELLRTDGAAIFVSGGLQDGDRVCMTSVGPVLPGTPVEVVATEVQRPQPSGDSRLVEQDDIAAPAGSEGTESERTAQ